MSELNKDEFQKLSDSGYSLIPLNGKRPFESSWQVACIQKRDYNRESFGENNVGIACGPASGILVLDVDDSCKFQNFLQENGYQLPETRTHRTGSGKPHYIFQYPMDGRRYGNCSRKSHGFDIRGEGGQIVAPGSIHPDTGELYTIEKEAPIEPAPQWVLDLSADGVRGGGVDSPSVEIDFRWADHIEVLQIDSEAKKAILEGIAVGKRSDAQASVICKLINHDPPLSDSQIHGIFDRYPIGDKMREKRAAGHQWLQADIDRIKGKIAEENKSTKKGKPNASRPGVSETLMNLTHDLTLFHTSDGELYASIGRNGHRENWHLSANGFKHWIVNEYFSLYNKPPPTQAVRETLDALRARALCQGETEEVHIRIGENNGNIYLDLANDDWEAIEITPDGWRVVSNPPVKFIRTNSTLQLPHPERGGSLEAQTLHYRADELDSVFRMALTSLKSKAAVSHSDNRR